MTGRVELETVQREVHMLEASYGERFEDHPEVALIQPGRRRYRLNEWCMQLGWNRGSLVYRP